jgi:hypothetical protein
MGAIKIEDIAGYNLNGKIVCCKCVTDEERNEAKEDEIITDRDLEDTVYWCDRCGEQL